MASSKRSRASRSNTPRAAAPKSVPARHDPQEAQRPSLASAILRQPPPVFLEPALLSLPEPAPAPKTTPTPAVQAASTPAVQATSTAQAAPVVQALPTAVRSCSADERRDLVAQLAYLRAERMGFGRTNPTEDWLWAEQEVTRRMQARAA